MRRALIGVICAIVATLAAPAIAQAGCQAQPGSVSAGAQSMSTYSYISCTSNNGSHYQMRVYFQANDGGWHSVVGPATWDFFSPPDNYTARRNASTGCSPFSAAATQARNKTVVENMVSGSTDVEFGPAVTLLASCQ